MILSVLVLASVFVPLRRYRCAMLEGWCAQLCVRRNERQGGWPPLYCLSGQFDQIPFITHTRKCKLS